MKQLLTYLLIIIGLSAQTQVTNLNFTNKPFTDPELPNYGRGAQFWNGTQWDNSGAPQVPPGTSNGKTFYMRYEWTSMENAMGQYTLTGNWPALEYSLKYAADRGQLFAFGGVMTAYDGQHGKYYDGAWSVYPEYLHQMMQAEPATPDWKYTATGNWIPNWNSPSYLERWRALNDTVYKFIMNWTYTPSSGPWAGKQIKGKDFFDYVDIRGYGNFGEWHTYPWSQNQPANAIITDSSMKKIIDISRDIYKNQQLMGLIAIFDDNGWSESNGWRAYYMLTSRNDYGLFGWRRDNIGDKGYDNFLIGNTWTYGNWRADTAILDRWKYGMITGEPLNGSGSGNCCPIYWHIRPEVNSYHYAGFGNGNYGVNTQAAFDTIREVFKVTGYRFNLNGGSMTTSLVPNQKFNVTMNWRNVGASPIYQKRWKVKYQLVDSTNKIVQTWISKFNPYLYLPDTKDSVVSDTFTLGNTALGNKYKLNLSVYDTVGLLDPIYLAINSPTRNTDGSYTVRSDISVYTSVPVKWYFFNGLNKNDFIELRWMVSKEETNYKFEIQRSTDGVNFYTIATVFRDSSYTNTETYKYLDYNQPGGNLYYRIKQIDIDDNFTYSTILRISGDYENTLKVYPNPTGDVLNIVVSNSFYGYGFLYLYSIDGKLVNKIPFKKSPGVFITTLNVKDLLTGSYIMRVTINNTTQGIQQFIKK